MKNDSNINAGYSLGKGEVVSSILTGSTSYAREMRAFNDHFRRHLAVTSRTYTETGNSNDGESVDSVRSLFPWEEALLLAAQRDSSTLMYPLEEAMDFDITTVRKLTGLRNRPGLAFHLKERLTTLLNTAEEINKETADEKRRNLLIQSFKNQWAEFVAAGGRDE